jgi:hypothetical protein
MNQDWQEKAAWMRLHGVVRATWDGGLLTSAELGPDPAAKSTDKPDGNTPLSPEELRRRRLLGAGNRLVKVENGDE